MEEKEIISLLKSFRYIEPSFEAKEKVGVRVFQAISDRQRKPLFPKTIAISLASSLIVVILFSIWTNISLKSSPEVLPPSNFNPPQPLQVDANLIENIEKEYQKTTSEFAKLSQEDPLKALQIFSEIVKLEEYKNNLERILGIQIAVDSSSQLQDTLKSLVERELSFLSSSLLSPEQMQKYNLAKSYYAEGNFQKALEIILELSNGDN